MKNRQCATSKALWFLYFVLAFVGLFMIEKGTIVKAIWQKNVYYIIFAYISMGFTYHLTHTIYLCDTGVVYYRFGKVDRLLPWRDICQICTIRLFPISFKVSQPTYILIVPKGVAKYDRTSCFGFIYLFAEKRKVYRIDDSIENRRIINNLYGEVEVQA